MIMTNDLPLRLFFILIDLGYDMLRRPPAQPRRVTRSDRTPMSALVHAPSEAFGSSRGVRIGSSPTPTAWGSTGSSIGRSAGRDVTEVLPRQIRRSSRSGKITFPATCPRQARHERQRVLIMVKNAEGGLGFLGSMGKPQPISEAEARDCYNARKTTKPRRPSTRSASYDIGEKYGQGHGAADLARPYRALVEELYLSRSRVRSRSRYLGRATPLSWASRSRGRPSSQQRIRSPGRRRSGRPLRFGEFRV